MPETIYRKLDSLYSFLTHRFRGKEITVRLRLGDRETWVSKTTLVNTARDVLPEGITMVALEIEDVPGSRRIRVTFDPVKAQGYELIKRNV